MAKYGASVIPKFIFGVKADVRNNIHYLDDNRVLYTSGHNVIIYNLSTKEQIFIPGIEGSDGITTLGLSHSHRFLAVCEKAERALCVIYDLYGLKSNQQPKKKKIITSSDYNSREFISVCFAPTNEKQFLATLTCPYKGDDSYLTGESKIILWIWEKSKCYAALQLPYSDANILAN